MAPSGRPRVSTAPNASNREPAALPSYEPPQHALNEKAQRAIANLPRDHRLDSLKHRLKAANSHLTQAAADVNDRYQIQSVQYEKTRLRREKQGSQGSNGDDERTLSDLKRKTDDVTSKVEEKVRAIIDGNAEIEGMEKALKELEANVINGRGRIAPTQSTLGASQFRQNRSKSNSDSGSEESEPDEDATQSGTGSAVEALRRKITDQRAAYQEMPMSDRYAQHNNYVGFKKIVHDAQYPDDQAPPMPHASTWFATESQDPTKRALHSADRTSADDIEDDDDIAIAAERISIKCPITLLPMKDPVTSRKCPHSFEKEAILSMINVSDITVGGNGRQGNGQRAMRCPVCEVLLTAEDLKEDPVLVRKIKRIEAAMNAQYEYSDDDDDDSGSQTRPSRPAAKETISSSPMATRTPQLKNERRSVAPSNRSREISMVPNTQIEDLTYED